MNEPTTTDARIEALRDPTLPLPALTDRGWDLHDRAPAAVAAALRSRASTLADDSASAAAIGLAEHVYLAHLHDASAFDAFLGTLAAAAAGSAAARRGRWVLARLADQEAPALDDAPRWRACQSLWSIWTSAGRAVDALAMLEAELPRARSHPDTAARQALAASCNNLAVELRLGARGDRCRDALMLALAEASRLLWTSAGTWVHAERAEYQLAHCHAVLGDGAAALVHARACLAAVEAHDGEPQSDAVEHFFAHEAVAWAARAAGDEDGASMHRARMVERLRGIDDAGSRGWCEEALAAFDAGRGGA